MNYSFDRLSVADCESVLEWAEQRKQELKYKIMSAELHLDKQLDSSADITDNIKILTEEMALLNQMHENLPDDRFKGDILERKARLEYKLYMLQCRLENVSSAKIVNKEFTIQCLRKELELLNAFMKSLSKQKALFEKAS